MRSAQISIPCWTTQIRADILQYIIIKGSYAEIIDLNVVHRLHIMMLIPCPSIVEYSV
jgi:hypothetical protein